MKNFIRSILSLAVALAVFLSLSACAGDKEIIVISSIDEKTDNKVSSVESVAQSSSTFSKVQTSSESDSSIILSSEADKSISKVATSDLSSSSKPQSISSSKKQTVASSEKSASSSSKKQTATSSKKSASSSKKSKSSSAASVSSKNSKTKSSIRALSSKQIAGLMKLDNTRRGWGPGNEVDSENRPKYALNAQNTYGKYDVEYIVEDSDKVYLTFDEGYENGYTSKILDTLKEKRVKAVFFITLSYAKNQPKLVRRMIDEGHIIGNHSSKHLSFPSMTVEEAYNDIKELHDYVEDNFGYTMKLFRFPMGESSDRMAALVQKMGYTSVFWSFAYADWDTSNQPKKTEALNKIVECAHPGALYLLHAVSKTNTEILPKVIDKIRAKGYEFAPYPVENK